jgi:RNA polymerase sigma-70 factor (ECF subfamily)
MVTAGVRPEGEIEDRRLASAFLESGDEDAFRTLYRRHAPALYAFLLRVSRGRTADAEEALQECWLRAVQSLLGFRWESSLRGWLRGIAVNCARERRRSAELETEWDLEDEPAASLKGVAPDRIDPIDLERAIEALPDGFREVFLLHDVEGHTHEEIGRMLGIAAGTSKSQLSRARAALRAHLGAEKERGDERVAR